MIVHITPINESSTDVSRVTVGVGEVLGKEELFISMYDKKEAEIPYSQKQLALATFSIEADEFYKCLQIVTSLNYQVEIETSSLLCPPYNYKGGDSFSIDSFNDDELLFKLGSYSFRLKTEEFTTLIKILLKK